MRRALWERVKDYWFDWLKKKEIDVYIYKKLSLQQGY